MHTLSLRCGFPRTLGWPAMVALLVAFVLGAALPAGAQAPQAQGQQSQKDPAALKAVQRAVNVYKTCTTYREKWAGEFAMVIGDQALPVKFTGQLIFKAPALVASTQQDSTGSKSNLVLTATKFYIDSADAKLSISGPAPKADDREALSALLSDTASPLPFGFLASRFGTFKSEDVMVAKSGVHIPSEWIKGLDQPEGCQVYTLVIGGEGSPAPVVVWLDPDKGVIRQMAMEMNKKIIEQMKIATGENELPEGLGFRMRVTLTEVAVDQPVADDAFTYAAPEGYKQVQAASAKEAVQRMAQAAQQAKQQQQQGSQQAQQEPEGLEGKTPPDFTAKTLDGKEVKLSDLKGKPVILDFWATWCPPCRREMPVLNEFQAKLKDQGLVVVCVSVDRDPQLVKQFVQQNKYAMTVWWVDPQDREGAVKVLMEKYGLRAIPRTLYISKDFIIKHDMTGLHPREEMVKAVADLGLDVSALEKQEQGQGQ